MIDSPRPVKKQVYQVAKDTGQPTKTSWWLLENSDEAGTSMWQTADNILLLQQFRQIDFYNYARMYGSRGLGYSETSMTLTPTQVPKTQSDYRLKLNAAKACVDTAQAKIAKNKPRPVFLTTGGDASQKRRAKKLTQYIDGAFDLAQTYTQAALAFRDSGIFGTGVIYVYPDYQNKQICTERVWIEEIIVDEAEGQYENPRQIFRQKLMHREVLLKMFPEQSDLLLGAASSNFSNTSTKDMILVREGWHLASSPEAEDGRHTIAIKEGTLLNEPYDKQMFPFVFFRWSPGLRSFYGTGIIEQVFSTQLEINQTCQTIQQAIYFAAVPRVYLSDQSKVISQHIDNRVGAIVKHQGNRPPIFDTPTANNPEMYNYLEYLWKKCFEQTGLSEMSATSQKPAGLDAAVAIREFHDIETQRFAIIAQQWEQFFIDIARLIIDQTKDMYEGTYQAPVKDLMVKTKNSKFLESIKWKDVNMPDDKYIMRCFPTSILPTTPAGRLAFIQELIGAGFIDRETGLNLLDYPDLERVLSIKNAGEDNALQTLERIVDEGVYDTPESYQNLDLCIMLGQGMYLKARNDNVEPERLELLRRWIDDCNDLKLKAAPAPAPVPAPMQAPAPEMLAATSRITGG